MRQDGGWEVFLSLRSLFLRLMLISLHLSLASTSLLSSATSRIALRLINITQPKSVNHTTTAAHIIAMPHRALPSRIQALPQELKDIIFDFAFPRLPSTTTATINSTYKPPTQMALTRSLRATFATALYPTTTFRFTSPTLATAWLKSLPKAHRDTIRHLDYDPQLPCNTPTFDLMPPSPMSPEQFAFLMFKESIKDAMGGWEPREGVLRVLVRFERCNAKWQTVRREVWTSDPERCLEEEGW